MSQLRAAQIAAAYGFTSRYWTRLAAQGKVPGARQPAGEHGHWLFDAAIFEKWWQTRVREVDQWPGYTAGAKSTGRVPSVQAESTGEASRRQIERLLSAVLGNGSPTLTPSPGATSPGGPSKRRRNVSSANT